MQQLLFIANRTLFSDALIWGAVVLIVALFIWGILWQRRQGRELEYELGQLDKLKENNIESDFVLRAMKLSTWHLDPTTMALTFDSDFRDRSGWIASLTDGTTVNELEGQLHPQDAEIVAKALADLCEGRTEEYHVEYRVTIPHSNKYYWEESYATIVERDVQGKPTSIVGTTMRIDNRKAMEQALIEARTRAEESDRMKSAFIANMSHEIRTPLNAIVGFTSIIPDITGKEERQQLLDLIHENTQKLLRIIDDVVNISKIESGQSEMVLSCFDLNQTLNDLIDNYRPRLKPGVELQTQYACDSLNITTDIERFNEITKHLLSNATKFTSKGMIVVGYDQPHEGRMRLWVRDTGIGISEENIERVFERFFKVDEFVPGAGLGLSICRTMAFSLGGTITVESKPGEGSTFNVEIPIH